MKFRVFWFSPEIFSIQIIEFFNRIGTLQPLISEFLTTALEKNLVNAPTNFKFRVSFLPDQAISLKLPFTNPIGGAGFDHDRKLVIKSRWLIL